VDGVERPALVAIAGSRPSSASLKCSFVTTANAQRRLSGFS
jgi:hypothetical protein